MEIKYECLPCLSRQLVTLATKVTKDQEKQKQIITYGFELLNLYAFKFSAPKLTGMMYEYAKKISGTKDPFSHEKIEFNAIAETLVKELALRPMISKSDTPFETAVRLSIAGNIIDFSVGDELDKHGVRESVELSLTSDVFGSSFEHFEEAVNAAQKIMIIGDNAGEIVFDKLLLERIPFEKITYVVKGGPIVNDATLLDAQTTGLTKLVKVIDTGRAMQGVELNNCSQSFKDAFMASDLIISKGQANFETLGDVKDKQIFFLLRAKCQSVADEIGCEKGEFVLKT